MENLSYFYTEKEGYIVISDGGEENEKIVAIGLNEADAKLITAAPELLEALTKIYDVVMVLTNNEECPSEITDDIINEAFRAVKKATD
jgi:hypothetical protein